VIPLARLLLAAGVCGVLTLAGASPALADVECTNTYNGQPIANCTTLTGPWVAVPAVQRTDQPTIANWASTCPSGNAVGADYQLETLFSQLSVYVYLDAGVTVYSRSNGVAFLAVNTVSRAAVSFRPLTGCLRESAAAVGQGRSIRRRIATRRLRPGRARTYSHGCRSGERLVSGSAGVGFFQRRPPTARELRQLRVRHGLRRGRVRVRVRTGKLVGDDERVALQIHAVCRP
jgi:hypothetical protein